MSEPATLKTSLAGARFLTLLEGKKNKAYFDSVGKLTIGVGHLLPPGSSPDLVWSDEQVAAQLIKDLETAEKAVNDVGEKLTQIQFDALVSLTFNIGAGAFAGSTVVKHLKAGEMLLVPEAMEMWDSHGLLKGRRAKEAGVFSYGTP